MKQDSVEAMGPAADRRFADDGSAGNFAGAPLQVNEVALHMLVDAALRCREHVVDGALEIGNAAAANGHGLDNRNRQLIGKPLRIELQSVAFGEVDHVQRNDGRKAKLNQLQREAEVVVEVGCVEDDDQRVGLAFALLPAEQHIAGHGLVRARRI